MFGAEGKIVKGRQDRHRPEDLLAPDLHLPGHSREDRGRNEVALPGPPAISLALPSVASRTHSLTRAAGRGRDHGAMTVSSRAGSPAKMSPAMIFRKMA